MSSYRLIERFLFPPVSLNQAKLAQQLHSKTVLITGASSGIGEQTARLLANCDIHLILVARRADKLNQIKAEIESEGTAKRARVSLYPADLRNSDEMEGLLSFLRQLPEGLDIIVSNAGLSIRRSLAESLDRYHDFTRTMAINYFAPVQLALSATPMLAKKQGHFVNLSTINILLHPFPRWAAYQASKSAFDTWLRSTSPELNAMGITTTTLYLPLVKTPMIPPTEAYRNLPAMHPRHVAAIICKSFYTKRKTWKPWWIGFGQWSSLLFRGLLERHLAGSLRKGRDEHENR